MIKIIKIGNLIYQNIEAKTIDENGNEVWNIPSDPVELKAALADTLGWIVGQNIVKTIGDANKKDTATSKSVVLLAKIIASLNPDTSTLTATEQDIFQKMLDLGSIGYSDSELLNNTIGAIQAELTDYAAKIAELEKLSTLDELIAFAENL